MTAALLEAPAPGRLLHHPALRERVRQAVLDRPYERCAPPQVWCAVGDALSAAAAALERTASSPAAAVLAAQVAEDAALAALVALHAAPGPGRTVLLQGRVAGGAAPVERTCWRLAGLLLGPAPTDRGLLAAALADSAATLASWRRDLPAPRRG